VTTSTLARSCAALALSAAFLGPTAMPAAAQHWPDRGHWRYEHGDNDAGAVIGGALLGLGVGALLGGAFAAPPPAVYAPPPVATYPYPPPPPA